MVSALPLPVGSSTVANALVAALNEAGLDAKFELWLDPKERRQNVITIRIGLKPQ